MSAQRPVLARVEGQRLHVPCATTGLSLLCESAQMARDEPGRLTRRGAGASAADLVVMMLATGNLALIDRILDLGSAAVAELDGPSKLDLAVAYMLHAGSSGSPLELIRALALLDSLAAVPQPLPEVLFDRALCLGLLGRWAQARVDAAAVADIAAAAGGEGERAWAEELATWIDTRERQLAEASPASRARADLEGALFFGRAATAGAPAVPADPDSPHWSELEAEARELRDTVGDPYWMEVLGELATLAARRPLGSPLGSLQRSSADGFSYACASPAFVEAERDLGGGPALRVWLDLQRSLCAYYERDFPRARELAERTSARARAAGWAYLQARADWARGLVDTLAGRFQSAALEIASSRGIMVDLGEGGLAAYLAGLQARNFQLAGAEDNAWRCRLEALRGLAQIVELERRQSLLDETVETLRATPFRAQARHFLSEQPGAPSQVRLLAAVDAVQVALDDRDFGAATRSLALARVAMNDLAAGHPNRSRLSSLIDLASARLERLEHGGADRGDEFAKTLAQLDADGDVDLQFLRELTDERLEQLRAEGAVERVVELEERQLASIERRLLVAGDPVARAGLAAVMRDLSERLARELLDLGRHERAGQVLDASRAAVLRRAGDEGAAGGTSEGSALTLELGDSARVIEVWRPETAEVVHLWVDREGNSPNYRELSVSPVDEQSLPELARAIFEEAGPRRDVYLVVEGVGVPQRLYSLLSQDPDRRYSVIPSVWLLSRLIHASRNKEPRNRRSALIVADPQLDPTAVMPELGRLAAARDEAEGIASAYQRLAGFAPVVLLGAHASPRAVLANWEAPDVVHFATHGLVLGRYDQGSGLVLSAGEGSGQPFVLWPAADAPSAGAGRRQLVVLAACRSSDRSWDAGSSLAAGFFDKGYATVIAAQGDLDDRLAAKLFVELHTSLAAGMDSYEALRRAKAGLDPADRDLASGGIWFMGLFDSSELETRH